MKTNWEKVGLSYNKELGEDEFIYQGIVEKEDRVETHSVKVPISIISAILDSLVMEEYEGENNPMLNEYTRGQNARERLLREEINKIKSSL